MSKNVEKFEALFEDRTPEAKKLKANREETPLGAPTSIYLSRETQAGIDQVVDYYRRKHGHRMSRSNVIRVAVDALVAALDTEAPDFEEPKVEIPN